MLAALLLVFSLQAHAGVVDDIPADAASPVTTSTARQVLFIGGGLALTAAIFEDSISDPIQEEATERRPLGHFASQMGALAGPELPNIAYALGMFAYAAIADDSNANRHALVMTKASIYAPIASGVIKFVVREPRPDGSDHFSFPSGHTTAAFSFASVIQAEHGWIPGAVAYAWAAVVGYGRMNDNRHFLHDVLAGAAIGASYGIGLHERSLAGSTHTSYFQVLPSDDLGGIVALYRRAF